MQIDERPIDDVKPYHRNPRKNDATIVEVMRSIKEFGCQQPIVVDQEGVIVVGHSRWNAMKRLGFKTVPVKEARKADGSWLTPAQMKAYRLKDNRTHELSTWNSDQLLEEILELKEADPMLDEDFLGFELQKVDEPAKREEWDFSKIEDHFVVTIRASQNVQPEVMKRLAGMEGVEVQVSQMKAPKGAKR